MDGSLSQVERTEREILVDGAILCVRLGERVSVVEACRTAAKGGLKVLEITLTTPGALDAISSLSDDELTVGAGTVLTVEDVCDVAGAGGKFAMSPVFDPEVVDEAGRQGILAIPGATTPTEILSACRHGARLIKVFPSGPLGGPDYLRAILGPLPDASLVPTSGPTAETVGDYFSAGAVALGVGKEVFHDGFNLESVEMAARRVRSAIDSWRSSHH